MRRLALLFALALALPGSASALAHHSNRPTPGAKPLAATTVHGRLLNTKCAMRTVQHNDRGLCVRAIQWLLTGFDPAWRCKYARKQGQRGANADCGYWHIRSAKPTGHVGRATVLQIQKAKFRLGYPAGRANGAAGPKFRAYLLGRPLPHSYVDKKEQRYRAWRVNKRGPPAKVKRLLELANRAIAYHEHYYYTQTSHRSDFLGGVLPKQLGFDCSGSISALYKLSGLPATGSAFPYDWTGSMQDRGRIVWHAGEALTKLHLGDLVFYGFGGAPYTHVAMVIAPGRVYTAGHTGCPCNASILYRDDVRIARRYFG